MRSRLCVLLLLASVYCCLPHVSSDGVELPYFTREKAEKSTEAFKSGVQVILDMINVLTKPGVLESFKKISSVIPVFGTLIGAVLNCVMAYLPQEDPVLNELRSGFLEVNRKLDSVSQQISTLRTEVVWYTYTSVYSQDEARIENAWYKLQEFITHAAGRKGGAAKLRFAERFTSFYENTATEGSVYSLYHYMTTTEKTLRLNLMSILVKQLKGNKKEIVKYCAYFRGLMWKGFFLNQFYYTLRGYDASAKAKESLHQYLRVIKVQEETVLNCMLNYRQYLVADVKDWSTEEALDKQKLAEKIKKKLDEKYDWYIWLVLVYNTEDEDGHFLFNYIKVPMDKITVAVASYDNSTETEGLISEIKALDGKCWESNAYCEELKTKINKCNFYYYSDHIDSYSKRLTQVAVIHMSSNDKELGRSSPPQFHQACWTSYRSNSGWFSVYRKSKLNTPCSGKSHCGYERSHRTDQCVQYGCPNPCIIVPDTNHVVCKCPDHRYGEKCEHDIKQEETQISVSVIMPEVVPDMTSISNKVTQIYNALKNKALI